MSSVLLKTRVWLGEDLWPGDCWEWAHGVWQSRGSDWLVVWGDVFILKSDRPTQPKRKPGLVRACYTAKDLGA